VSNPHDILNGGVLSTFGGHKGAAISMMVELLCAALVGSAFSADCEFDDKPGLATVRKHLSLSFCKCNPIRKRVDRARLEPASVSS
jgi:LDH2 family malate/lactate/ureidoglycolate dehydrogenase